MIWLLVKLLLNLQKPQEHNNNLKMVRNERENMGPKKEALKEGYITTEEKQKIIDDLRLI